MHIIPTTNTAELHVEMMDIRDDEKTNKQTDIKVHNMPSLNGRGGQTKIIRITIQDSDSDNVMIMNE